jgi:hypothetical protein
MKGLPHNNGHRVPEADQGFNPCGDDNPGPGHRVKRGAERPYLVSRWIYDLPFTIYHAFFVGFVLFVVDGTVSRCT